MIISFMYDLIKRIRSESSTVSSSDSVSSKYLVFFDYLKIQEVTIREKLLRLLTGEKKKRIENTLLIQGQIHRVGFLLNQITISLSYRRQGPSLLVRVQKRHFLFLLT